MADDRPFVLPRRVQVGPYWYSLRRDVGVDAANRDAETNHHPVREIVFARSTKELENPDTFIHEVIHAIEKAYVMPLKEEQVTRLAHGLTQALQSAGLLPERIALEGDDA